MIHPAVEGVGPFLCCCAHSFTLQARNGSDRALCLPGCRAPPGPGPSDLRQLLASPDSPHQQLPSRFTSATHDSPHHSAARAGGTDRRRVRRSRVRPSTYGSTSCSTDYRIGAGGGAELCRTRLNYDKGHQSTFIPLDYELEYEHCTTSCTTVLSLLYYK